MTRVTRRSIWFVAVVLTVLTVLGISVGHAAALTLSAGIRPHLQTQDRCGAGPATVTPTGTPVAGKYTQVRVTGLSGACATGRVVLYTPNGPVFLNGTGAVSDGAFTASTATAFTPPTGSAAQVYVALNTWPVASSWSFTPAPSSGGTCEIIGANPQGATCTITFGADTDGRDDVYNVKASVTTTSTVPVQWRATFDFTNLASFPFVARYVGEYAGNWSLQALPANFCTASSSRVVSYVGRGDRGSQQVVAGSALTLDFVGSLTSFNGNYVVYSCP